MSKIYEALLRAERDLQSTDPKPIPPAPVPPPVAITLDPASAEAAFIPGRSHLHPTGPIGCREVHWSPVLERLPALQERGSTLEQFRMLRSRLQGFRSLNNLKSILVSSGRPQEGKSFVSVNLALTLARHKASRVLLIDGDMRRSSLHHVLGCQGEPGLTEYLSGSAPIEAIMQRPQSNKADAPLPKGLASLTFIAAGGDAANAADLSMNQRFSELIQTAYASFDWIIIDSSPVGLVSDAVNLARAAEGVLLVARGGVTKFETAQRAMAEFKSQKVLGFVLNAIADAPLKEGYYGYDSKQETT